MNKQLKFGLACFAVLLVSGCASNVRISDKDQALLSKTYVDNKVQAPKKMYYYGPGQAVISTLSPVIGAISMDSEAKSEDEIAKQNGVDIKKIVYDEFTRELHTSMAHQVRQSADATAKVNLNIKMYGFSVATGFSSTVKPVMSIEAEAVNNEGKVIWRQQERVMPLGNPFQAYPPSEINAKPELMNGLLHNAAARLAKKLVLSCCVVHSKA